MKGCGGWNWGCGGMSSTSFWLTCIIGIVDLRWLGEISWRMGPFECNAATPLQRTNDRGWFYLFHVVICARVAYFFLQGG